MKYKTLAIILSFLITTVYCHGILDTSTDNGPLIFGNGVFNLKSIDSQLTESKIVQDLNFLLKQFSSSEQSWIHRLFSTFFPFGPALNALLATTYISGPPNLLLALIPPQIEPSKLSTLISFAVGGLLGDVFLHLLPQTFVGEVHGDSARFILVDERRNTILGLGIFGGFVFFVIMDKLMRILTFSSGNSNHGHSHKHEFEPEMEDSMTSSRDSGQVRNRKNKKQENGGIDTSEPLESESESERSEPLASEPLASETVKSEPGQSVKLSAYLNLIADFTHNITDGLAISASFYVSKNVGATTCLAVFFHEIPHEVGDFALLVQGGFSKSQAMWAQFVTAIGAYLGTFLGIFVNYLASKASDTNTEYNQSISYEVGNGIFGTNVTINDLTLPFTAGGFLYIATVGVIPEILESHELIKGGTKARLLQAITQLIAMLIGIGLMFVISWME